jgi:NhaA family Na+:H+ antiporter
VLLPVGIYLLINRADPAGIDGWAIPAATDIAFALGILMMLGSRVPISLKVFLVSLAIFDDLAAILIIAFFYTSNLSMMALVIAGSCIVVLGIMAKRGVSSISPYIWVGLIMWVAVLKSGVHATLAGVTLAAFIPMRSGDEPDRSPLRELEHDLHGLVAFFILPLFAFANSGVSLQGIGLEQLLHPVPLGIAAGLFFGKQLGIFLSCWLAIRLGIARMPKGASWMSLYGVAALCGVGFTMSLFVGSLAFEGSGTDLHSVFDERLGIIVGSIASGIFGYLVLRHSLPKGLAED